ncbi:hypothetical protein TALK_13210 [Thalassospira alkalitolerans]|uniref:Uncharacterized protein n=1 Tax=Thalassospira alkalitolerans TaxID=1293890 RepID=A0A1Y2LC48_9PROT|nr:hypothetical protein TALK_13210 [Thalassospira alkalitolerans]
MGFLKHFLFEVNLPGSAKCLLNKIALVVMSQTVMCCDQDHAYKNGIRGLSRMPLWADHLPRGRGSA